MDSKKSTQEPPADLNNHLANERTFLAWVRTSMGIMAFGFVVVKFSLFIKEISIAIQKPLVGPNKGYSSYLGIFLVAFGVLIGLLAYFRYKRIEREIIESNFRTSNRLATILTICILLVGIFLVVYLVHSV
jgi:putative membrane protein